MSMRVETKRDSNGRLDQLTIYRKGRKAQNLQFVYGSDGFLKDIEFTGRKEDMPTVSDIVALINEKFIERIGSIGTIGNINRLAENESGLISSHIFASADVFEDLAEFVIDWRQEPQLAMRRFLDVKCYFENTHASNQYYAQVRVLEDNNRLDDKVLFLPAGAKTCIEVFTMQPPLYKAKATYKIQGKVGNTAVRLLADQKYTKWETERCFGIVEDLRQEYSPSGPGVAIWTTPTLIPHWTEDEFRKSWNWATTLTTASEAPSTEELPPTDPFPRCLKVPNGIRCTGLHNILYGQLSNINVKWGINPQTGADRSIGFDFPAFQDFMGFHMSGDKFYAKTKHITMSEATEITWDNAWSDTWTRFYIIWKPDLVEFYINEVLKATHALSVPFPAGLCFLNNDAISGYLRIGNLELEQCAGQFPTRPAIAKSSSQSPAATLDISLYIAGRKNIQIFVNGANATFCYVSVSQDGSTWRTIDTITLTASVIYRTYVNASKYIRLNGNSMSLAEINASD